MTKAPNLGRSIRLVRSICRVAGAPDLIDDSRVGLAQHGVIAAVRRHDTPIIFDWLVNGFSYQGVSDSIAEGYMERHGRMRWHDIAKALVDQPSCPKLTCYWAFEGCGYRKGAGLCANPDDQPGCPLPRHDLRNGRLNQTAYSLFLFMRDLAGGTSSVGSISGSKLSVRFRSPTDRLDCAERCSNRSVSRRASRGLPAQERQTRWSRWCAPAVGTCPAIVRNRR